ncbi:hypothetical protein F0562_036147 [Nyssa sinensis]|uniref:F-box domain-containing protein n=1 Tax=Nyssa sinensis TaxID=561372 RepID=A0A5J5AG27_9ASTE|nr:hypothetical protein F0562_036147 [Nyssa sinensis]
MAVDWSGLPPELIETIAKKLTIHIDYIRFRAVCVNWRSSISKTPHHLPCQFPWLMLPQSRTHQTSRRGFFSISDNKVHFLNVPEASHRRRRCGSSHGWLVILDESPAIFLLNPLNRAKIHLPPLSAFPNVLDFNFYDVGREYVLRNLDGEVYTCNLREMRDSFIKKVILSSNPSNDRDFIALAILNQIDGLAFCKKGEQSWRFIEGTKSYCEDVVYHNGFFYAVNKYGAIAVCDVQGPSPRVSIIETPPQIGGDMQYLVPSMDELLLVTRYLDLEFDIDHHQLDIVYKTMQFEVYRLDLSGPKWERVTSLGDRVLFLGENSSLSLLAYDFPGCKGNCIYYTDDYSEFNYVDGASGNHDLDPPWLVRH